MTTPSPGSLGCSRVAASLVVTLNILDIVILGLNSAYSTCKFPFNHKVIFMFILKCLLDLETG